MVFGTFYIGRDTQGKKEEGGGGGGGSSLLKLQWVINENNF